MSSRQHVMIALKKLETRLWNQQAQVDKHKRYFRRLLQDSNVMVPAMLFPAFLMGWKTGQLPRVGLMLWKFGEFVLLSLISSVRRL